MTAESPERGIRSEITATESAPASITAAQFLQRFVDKTPWAHLDIAGVAWQDGEHKALAPTWGTGWGVRVLDRLVSDHYEK